MWALRLVPRVSDGSLELKVFLEGPGNSSTLIAESYGSSLSLKYLLAVQEWLGKGYRLEAFFDAN